MVTILRYFSKYDEKQLFSTNTIVLLEVHFKVAISLWLLASDRQSPIISLLLLVFGVQSAIRLKRERFKF